MHRSRTWTVGLALAIAAVAVTVGVRMTNPAQALTNCDTSTGAMDGIETQLLQLLNERRAESGLPALLPSPGLSQAAAWMSEDYPWGGNLNHNDSLDRPPRTRAANCGYGSGFGGENLAWGYGDAAAVLDAWMGSPGHRANILGSGYVVAGVGYSGGVWTLDFGFVDDSTSPPPPPSTAGTQIVALPSPTPTATATPTPTPIPTRAPARAAVIALLSRD